jgi:hypothetical protein
MTGNAFNTWESHLHKAVFGMNATPQASTRYSPFYLATGLHARIPLRLPVDTSLTLAITDDDLRAARLPERAIDLNKTHSKVKDNVSQAQDRQTAHHAKRVKVEPTAAADADGSPASEQAPLEPGSRVYMMKPGRNKGWEGPYKLVELNGPNATLEDGTTKRWRVHINRLAKDPSQPPHTWYLGSS